MINNFVLVNRFDPKPLNCYGASFWLGVAEYSMPSCGFERRETDKISLW